MDDGEIRRQLENRNVRYRKELEDYLRTWIIDGYRERADAAFARDYSSADAYEKSVEPNRARWREILGPPDLRAVGDLEAEPFEPLADIGGLWLRLPLNDASGYGSLRAEAAFAAPAGASGPVPLVICQHGIGSSPERTFGLDDKTNVYKSYARRLVEAGFAVLSPFNLFGSPERGRIERLAKMAGMSMPGIELARVQRLLDAVLARSEIDGNRVGLWGISLGGLATQFWTPLEPRIKAAVSCAWFNRRLEKMIVQDPRYSCFLETPEAHAFIKCWLCEFDDVELCSLICPRPFLIQCGKADNIAWWPWVMETFEALKVHYDKLGLGDRVAIDLHELGHEIRVDSGVEWMKRWLG